MLKPQASRSERSGRQRLVKIERPEEVVLSRSELPIIGMEQEVVEAILEHDIVVLSGETGCGKTTQVGTLNQFCKPFGWVKNVCAVEVFLAMLLVSSKSGLLLKRAVLTPRTGS